MNMKKIAILALSLCMIAAIAITGTLAYFTDYDSQKNVMTVGQIDIEQNEKDDDGNPFEQDQDLIPAPEDTYDSLNHIDKVVTVTNKGTLPAYVRTIFAFEDNKAGEYSAQMHALWNQGINEKKDSYEEGVAKADSEVKAYDVVWMVNDDGSWMSYESEGVTYTIAVVTYAESLAAGATSAPSLMEIWLDDAADNTFFDKVGSKYEIFAMSQASQVGEETDPKTALDTAFGKITEENLKTWLSAAGL